MEGIYHLVRHLLCQYRHWDALVVIAGKKWNDLKRRWLLDHRNFQSTMAHVTFLREAFDLMMGKGKWVMLLY